MLLGGLICTFIWLMVVSLLSVNVINVPLQSVRGHSGNQGNEQVDGRANTAINLPDAPVQLPAEVGHISYHRELFTYPHKVWTRQETPMHRHKVRMLETVEVQIYYLDPLAFRWHCFTGHLEHTGAMYPQQCLLCKAYHSKSVHGYLGHCGEHSKLVQIWL